MKNNIFFFFSFFNFNRTNLTGVTATGRCPEKEDGQREERPQEEDQGQGKEVIQFSWEK